jgi:2-oxoglutarate dehydrogenase E2 component (dihydrolipoamide succinyltransferase)
MSVVLRVPQLSESIADATLVAWRVQPGQAVRRDEAVAELETDKVVLEVTAPVDGVLCDVRVAGGAVVRAGDVLALIDDTADVADGAEYGHAPVAAAPAAAAVAVAVDAERPERRVAMSRMRKRIAEHLVEARATQAATTTYNEIDVSAIQELRARYNAFFDRSTRKLGMMPFFVKACIAGLEDHPIINARIDGDDIVYCDYYDIGIAVSTDRGVMVPVIRHADRRNLRDIEDDIAGYAERARRGDIALDDLRGGTFSITNGGVFGSLLSAPIIHAPQSAILGMHRVQDRPVAVDGQVVIRPMMYVALSYDHRLIDGQDAVRFLVTVKDCLEDPRRLLGDA